MIVRIVGLALFLAGLVLFLFWPEAQAKVADIRVQLVSEGGATMPVVTLHDIGEANEMVVRTFYLVPFSFSAGKILLSKVSVTTALEGIGIATDSVPVGKDDVQAVEVTLVKDLEHAKFSFEPPK